MTTAEELALLHDGAALVDRSDRGFVLVTGPDALSFLQAIVSADLDPVRDGQGVRSLLLTPQGKLDVAFRLLRVGDDAWLDCDPGLGAQLAESLSRFRIRVKADVLDRSGEWAMVSVVGPRAGDRMLGDAPRELHDHHDADGGRLVRAEHGYDLVAPAARVAAGRDAWAAEGVPVVSRDAYEAFRIEHGIPVQPFDIDARTIPQEAFLERDAVSFTKGCFLGQELVCRIDSRGHVNRFLRRLTDIDGAWPERGAGIFVDDAQVGEVTSVAPPAAPVGALGYVRREVEPPAVVELRSAVGRARAHLTPG